MNELQLKQLLQTFLAAGIPTTFWDASKLPRCFVNVYQGNAVNSDSIVSKQSRKDLSIELSIQNTHTSLETLDDVLLGYKIQIESLIRNNKKTKTISGLRFIQWTKEIEVDGTAETEIRYHGTLKMFYKLSIWL